MCHYCTWLLTLAPETQTQVLTLGIVSASPTQPRPQPRPQPLKWSNFDDTQEHFYLWICYSLLLCSGMRFPLEHSAPRALRVGGKDSDGQLGSLALWSCGL